MSIKIDFPKTNIVRCHFLKSGAVHPTRGINKYDGADASYYRPTDFELDNTRFYDYKCIDGIKPNKGDLVVVSCATGFAICEVMETNIMPSRTDYAYVVGTVDVKAYKEYVQKEQEKEKLKAVLKARKEEMEQMAVYELLADKDEGFAELLKKFKELGGTF